MTENRRITDRHPDQPLQWEEGATSPAAPAAGQAGLAKDDFIYEADDGTVAASRDGEIVWHAHIYANDDSINEAEVALNVALRLAAPVAADTEQARPHKVDASMISRYRYAPVMGVYELSTGEYVKLEQVQALLRAAGIQLVTDGRK